MPGRRGLEDDDEDVMPPPPKRTGQTNAPIDQDTVQPRVLSTDTHANEATGFHGNQQAAKPPVLNTKEKSHAKFIPDDTQDDEKMMAKKQPAAKSSAEVPSSVASESGSATSRHTGDSASHARFVPDSSVARAPAQPSDQQDAVDLLAKKRAAAGVGSVAVAAVASRSKTHGGDVASGTATMPQSVARAPPSPGTSGKASGKKSNVENDPESETKIGAVAVAGMAATDPTRTASYQSNFSYTEQPDDQQPDVLNEEQPLEATVVASRVQDEADVEAQVQERMRNEADNIADMIQERILKSAVVAEVHTGDVDQSSADGTAGSRGMDEIEASKKRKKMWIFAGLAVLVIAAAIGAGVGVAASNKSSPEPEATTSKPRDPPTSPPDQQPPTGQCSFCADGSTPSNLDINMVVDQTCAEYQAGLIQLDASDPGCPLGQSVAWLFCGCPTLPPAPQNPSCTLCEGGEAPLASNAVCADLDIFIQHVGSDPLFPCEELISSALEGGCVCPGDDTLPPAASDIDLFKDVLVSISGDRLDDTSSPQYQALEWIADNDPAETSVLFTDVETIERRYVAAVIYYALGGENWENQYNFLSADDICEWNQNNFNGLVCSSSSDNVITLRFSDNNLIGTIPEEISYFSSLGTVEMRNDAIRGTLPSSLSDLKLMSELDVTSNLVTGTIPDFLYSHAQLTTLALEGNGFTGTINPSLGTAPRLENYWCADNELTGPIPAAVGQSTVLLSVDVIGNSISGPLPEFSSASGMQLLYLRDNLLTGTIPESIGNLTDLEVITVANNNMNGAIPDFSGNQGSLRQLEVFANRLTGAIENIFMTAPPSSLELVDIAGNEIGGTLPTLIGQFTALTSLRLFDNQIEGSIPTEVGMLTDLSTNFLINDNGITGTIPTEIGQWTKLQRNIQLNGNELTGPLPTTLGNLGALENMFLFDNQLTGSIPTELGGCTSLQILNFGQNQLDGDIGPAIDTLPRSLVILDLDTNGLGGTIPTSITTFTNLDFLDFHINNLNGTIPSEFGVMTQLSILALSTNQFTGTVPSSLASLTNLSEFYLLENDLTGSLDAFCAIDFDFFAANTCTEDEIECSCCTHCCTPELSCTEL